MKARRVSLMVAAGAATLGVLLPALVSLRVDWSSFLVFGLFCAFFLPFLPYLHWRGLRPLVAVVECFLLAVVLTVPVLVVSYCAMRLNLPMADDRLAGLDARFAVDAPTLIASIGRSPVLASALGHAYSSFGPQLILLPPALALLGHPERAYAMVTGYVTLCFACIAISAGFPSVGTVQHYGLAVPDLGAINGFFGHHFLDSFHAVRADPDFILTLGVASGIITFPSIHAGVAVLCAWATSASRFLFPPIALLNVLMFVSAISHGAHYVVDVVAGGLIAVLVIHLVSRASGLEQPRRPRLSPGRGVPAGAGAARSA